ncbi:uncharacterized protein LODBEIA_P28100 [Lodderomyces beijingensis]|uniref:Cwf19-like C-terminal domain-containing protein n=1 Tax=Lodderomyces beijingensis TaxID=1775926 RepID=A0ABP0ZN89_9ASCO
MAAETTKILVANPSPDNLEKVLERCNVQNDKNGPFAATVLLGDVIPENHHLPSTELNESMYFTRGYNGISDEVEAKAEAQSQEAGNASSLVDVAENLTYVKPPYSLIKLVSGTTMLILSGPLTQELVTRISNVKQKIDLLVSYKWPLAIAEKEMFLQVGDEVVDEVVKLVKPRYHFAVGTSEGKFYEHEPFRWISGEVTRFISLGQEGGKEKWYYAFTISGGDGDDQHEVETVENPFSRKRKCAEDTPSLSSVAKRKKPKTVTPDECFFCLSNPTTETHMIVSIGSHSYLTVAKGPLTRSNKDLSFSGHGILIPIKHIPSIGDEDEQVKSELKTFESTLVRAFAEQRPFLKLIFYELSKHDNVHHNVQFLPVYEKMLDKFAKSLAFRTKLNNDKFKRNQILKFQEFANPQDEALLSIENSHDFIKFIIHFSPEQSKIYIAKLARDKPVDVHQGNDRLRRI